MSETADTHLMEEADCIGAATDAGKQHIWLASKCRLALPPRLPADHCLEVPHLGRGGRHSFKNAACACKATKHGI